jgi:site-specific DNA recombinase
MSNTSKGGEMSKTSKRKRAVIYLRVSSDKQVNKEVDPEGLSIPSQRKLCEAHAARMGAEVVREYVEPGISAGSVLKRKAFKKMLADTEELRDVDVVIFWKVSRWARDEIDQWSAFGLLQQQGVELASASEPIGSSPTGLLVFGIMGSIAAHDRRQLSIEVTRGLTQKVEVGGTPGLAPLGYSNCRQMIDGREVRTVELDPVRGPLIKEAFCLYASGEYSLMELAALMEERGLRSRATKRAPEQALPFKRFAEILRNPYYIGQVRYAGKVYPGRHEPLIDPGTYQDVQDLLDAKRQSGERSWRNFHYLRGTIYCAECGGRLTYMRPRGNGGVYEYFTCSGRRKQTCSQGYHRVEAIETAVERHYGVAVKLPAEQRAKLQATVEAYVRQLAGQADEKLSEARVELSRLDSQERKLLKAHYADQVSEELFAEEQGRIRRERDGVEQRIKQLGVKHDRVLGALDVALDLMGDMQLAYRQAGPNERRLLNQAFFERIEIAEEEVVGSQIAEPFAGLKGITQQEAAEREAAKAHLAASWDLETELEKTRFAEPFDGSWEAETLGLFSETEGSNVEALVRLRGVEPPRALAHTDLNRARLPVPPQPPEQAIY